MALGRRLGDLVRSWPLIRQATGDSGQDPLGRGASVTSPTPYQARTDSADRVVDSICPFCAVG